MLKIFEELFGLEFVEIIGEDRAAIAPTGKGKVSNEPTAFAFIVPDTEYLNVIVPDNVIALASRGREGLLAGSAADC
jgi:cold shock CspA family protein